MRKWKTKLGNTLISSFIGIFCSLFILPITYIIAISFSKQYDLETYGFSAIPRNFTFEAYNKIFEDASVIVNAYGVSIFVTVVGTVMSLLFTSMFAYVLSRNDFKLNKILMVYIVITMLFSGGMVTSYILITQILHLKDSLLALILPYTVISVNVFLMRGFMMDLPSALFESAKIDGAGELTVFLRIVLPMSRPALATIGLITSFTYWNDWWLAMMYMDNDKLIPIQLMLNRVMQNVDFLASNREKFTISVTEKIPTEPIRMAVCLLAAGPMIIIFPFFQKHFIKGMVIGAIKG